MGFIEKGLEILYPSNIHCLFCGSAIDNTRPYALCDTCMEKFHWLGDKTCGKCGKLLPDDYRHDLCYDCRAFPRAFEKGYTCVQYGLYERGLMMDYKYRGKSYIGRKLGDILYDRMALENFHADYIVPVPMHEKKQQKRGYNQAAIMAKRLARRMEAVYIGNLLARCRETKPMKGLGSFERQENLRGAFAVQRGNRYAITGKDILLVDDIYTTGSTMDQCSKILLEAGANQVFALSFAAGANLPPRA